MGRGHRTLQESLLAPRADQVLPHDPDLLSLLARTTDVVPERKIAANGEIAFWSYPTLGPTRKDGTKPGLRLPGAEYLLGQISFLLDTNEPGHSALAVHFRSLSLVENFVQEAIKGCEFTWHFNHAYNPFTPGVLEVSAAQPGQAVHVAVNNPIGELQWCTAVSFETWVAFVQRLHYAVQHDGDLQL